MNIVVLDGFTLNPGDLDWGGLRALGGSFVAYARTPIEVIEERARDAEIVLTNKTPLRAETLKRLPKLKYIGVLATGYDCVDVAAAAARGIVVANVPSYGTDSVAQFVFALVLELAHRVGLHSDSVHHGEWSASPDFCYWRSPLVELAGKTFGIVGIGRIGRRAAELAAAFGMRVKAYSPRATPASVEGTGIELSSLEDVLRDSDFVSLHCPLTEETRGLINRDRLALMKPTAYLVNTARGPLIVEEDLAAALREGRLAGAALDVLSKEPPEASPLFGLANCILTPHIAWASFEARSRLLAQAVDNVRAFLAGAPIHVVAAK